MMDVTKILAELRQECEQIEQAIVTMERLVHGSGRRRGRPPAWLATLAPRRRGRPPGSKNKAKARIDPLTRHARQLTPSHGIAPPKKMQKITPCCVSIRL
jgi:hypothetical protein